VNAGSIYKTRPYCILNKLKDRWFHVIPVNKLKKSVASQRFFLVTTYRGFIAKQKLVITNQNPRYEWRRKAPPLASWVLSQRFLLYWLRNSDRYKHYKP